MPAGPRLARALLPHPRPWHLLGAAAATAEGVFPMGLRRGSIEPAWKRPYSQAALQTGSGTGNEDIDQQSRQAQGASASIFEELFPGEALPHHSQTPESDVHLQGRQKQESPAREDVLEEIQQWLQSEAEAGEARKKDTASASTSATAARLNSLRTPKGDWGLHTSTRRTAPSPAAAPSLSKPAERYAQPTVLVLSGTTPCLMPSDFFRIAPRITDSGSGDDGSSPNSRPVDGWSASNGGIYKIVQDRDPVTLAPRGRYFLYFGSPGAALAYAQEMRELHKLARRAVMPAESGKSNSRRLIRRRNEDRNAVGHAGTFTGSGGGADSLESDPFAHVTGSITTASSGLAINSEGGGRGNAAVKQPSRRVKNSYSNASLLTEGTEDQMEALRNFSLVVPTVRLHLSMQMPAAAADGAGMYRPSKKSNRHAQATLYDSEALDDVAATDTTTKVLVVLTSAASSAGSGSYSSYVNADGRGVITIEGLRSLIAEDGVRRNLPWGVSYGLNGVVPVRWLVQEQARLMRKARAAARQSQNVAAEAGEEDGAKTLEQRLTDALGQMGDETPQAKKPASPRDDKKQPTLPTALWASRLPDLAAKTAQMDDNGRFSRFVVSFSHNAEARRFVRGWHRRTVNVRMEHAMSPEHMQNAIDAALERGEVDVSTRVPAVVEASVVW